ncbi:hypothetical protein [Burkholderia stagnalis]
MALATPLDSLFKRNPVIDWDDVHPMFGDVICSLDGQIVFRGDYPEYLARRPAVIDDDRTVTGDLIPETSWGASLYNLLAPAAWEALRAPVLARNHRVCELCGIQLSSLDVHEIWEYDCPPDDEMARRDELTVFGVQRLCGLMSVCQDCHLCFHLGLANARGKLSTTLDRLAALNNWSRREVDDYYQIIGDRWERASQIHWMLDFAGLAHPHGGLVLKPGWRLHPDDARFVLHENHLGHENVTALLNIPWRTSGEKHWRPMLSSADMN